MNELNSLVNIGDLAKPATTLIEKVADFTGACFLPRQIIRVAKAQAKAGKIKAFADLEISEIQKRGLARLINEEGRSQANIENIVAGSLRELKEDAKPEEIDDDWLTNFFDKCKKFSAAEMQSLWSKILAGEANKADSFSKRTIEIVSTFDKNDAQLFTNLCCFGWNIDEFRPLIYGATEQNENIYKQKDMIFGNLHHLETIGLIRFEGIANYGATELPKIMQTSYYDTQINLEFQAPENNQMILGEVLLTNAGKQLAPICGSEKVEGFLDFILNEWQKIGYITSSAFPKSGIA